IPRSNQRSTPKMVLRVAEDFPELTIIAAHLGGLNMWNEVITTLAGRKNVFMETSMTYENIPPTIAEKIIRKHNPKKIFFGTDYPFAPIKSCAERAQKVSFLTAEEKEDLIGLNAHRFFQL
ncbi:MAG: amidohydrolase family protein, partial [Thermodesulfobacteriota bacterium]|nr:amidohydrolase family protein [Thermodesulfobacteriota bacterium]